MKRVLLIFLVLFLAVAVWFRWLDELDPVTVKGEIQTQTAILKERSQTFSLKDEIARIIEMLDRFFSVAPEEMVVIIPSEDSNELYVITQDSENVVENLSVQPSEEFPVIETEILENLPEVDPNLSNSSVGYPAPVADPIESLSPAPTTEVIVLEEQTSNELSSDPLVSQEFDFNQLQETVPGSFLPYNLQSVEPLFISNFVHPEAGCNWLGIAGQIFGVNNEPKEGLIVVVEGAVNNSMVEVLGFSGLAQAYGPGGYELVLSEVNNPGIFWIQLFDVEGNPLSEIYSFQMNGTCEQNLAIINFTLNNDAESKYVPTVTP